MKYLILLILLVTCSSPNRVEEHHHDLPIRIMNLKNDSQLQTGFVMGTANGENIDYVEIKLDDNASQKANGISNWKFKLPFGKDIWKLGSYHRIEARIIYKNGIHSESHVVHVIKDQNIDTNGNGYADHVEVDKAEEKLYVVYGSKEGVKDKSIKSAGKVWKPQPTDKNFGQSYTIGDVDGDGYADIIVGSNQKEDDFGVKAYMYNGSEKHPDNGQLIFHKNMTGQTSSSYFGVTFQLGDQDSDGYSNVNLIHPKQRHVIKGSEIKSKKKK